MGGGHWPPGPMAIVAWRQGGGDWRRPGGGAGCAASAVFVGAFASRPIHGNLHGKKNLPLRAPTSGAGERRRAWGRLWALSCCQEGSRQGADAGLSLLLARARGLPGRRGQQQRWDGESRMGQRIGLSPSWSTPMTAETASGTLALGSPRKGWPLPISSACLAPSGRPAGRTPGGRAGALPAALLTSFSSPFSEPAHASAADRGRRNGEDEGWPSCRRGQGAAAAAARLEARCQGAAADAVFPGWALGRELVLGPVI